FAGAERRLRCVIARHRPDSFADQDLRAFSRDGSKLAAFDGAAHLKVWDTRTGEELGRLKLDVRPELFAFAGNDQELRLVYLGREVRSWRSGADATRLWCKLETNPQLEQDRAAGWWKAGCRPDADA